MSIGPEYIAGFFDGEGCISARVDNDDCVKTALLITQKDKEVLIQIKTHFGYGSLRNNSRGLWEYRITGAKLKISFLEAIYPFLIEKKEQVRLGLILIKRFDKRRLSEEEKEVRIELANKISKLKNNRKGRRK